MAMLRPLLVNQALALVFDEPEGIPPIYSDESKVSQILRNFISNALKFTERGSVTVQASHDGDDAVLFSVRYTGIGIAPEDHELVFEEFTQVPNPLQRKVKGTGHVGKAIVMGLLDREAGHVRAAVVPGTRKHTLQAEVEENVEPGARVIDQGDDPDDFFVLESGTLEVRKRQAAAAPEEIVAVLTPGAGFGEIGLLQRIPRT